MTQARFTHIGGPTTLIEVGGWRILTDPTFDPAGRRYSFGWGTASRKTTGPSVAATDLGTIDVAFVSHHHHADNLDPAGTVVLRSCGRVVTTSKAAEKLGGIGLRPGETTTLESPGKPTLTITATPCRHGPPGMDPITGPVIGFRLAWDGQTNGELWITGDTVLYPALREAVTGQHIGTVLLHLGAVRFRYLSGPLRYSMNAAEGAELLDLIEPVTAIPVHYEGWTHFSEGRTHAEPVLARANAAGAVRWLDPGEEVTVDV